MLAADTVLSIQGLFIPFMAGLLLSFLGSMPPGMISLTVAKRSMEKGISSALLLAGGAAFVEFFQTIIAVCLSQSYSEGQSFQAVFQWIAWLVFLVLGLYYLLVNPTNPVVKDPKEHLRLRDFGLGIWIGSLNMLAFPYWMFYGTFLQVEGYLQTSMAHFISMGIGVSLGTFFVLWIYAETAQILIQRMPQWMSWTNRGLGLIMLSLSLIQLWNLL